MIIEISKGQWPLEVAVKCFSQIFWFSFISGKRLISYFPALLGVTMAVRLPLPMIWKQNWLVSTLGRSFQT